MSDVENSGNSDEHVTEQAPTQAQLYDDLRRIGQLEDQKHAIQGEIDQRTERLRQAIPQLDPSSLLYQILSSTLKPAKAKPGKRSRRSPTKKKTAGKKR